MVCSRKRCDCFSLNCLAQRRFPHPEDVQCLSLFAFLKISFAILFPEFFTDTDHGLALLNVMIFFFFLVIVANELLRMVENKRLCFLVVKHF